MQFCTRIFSGSKAKPYNLGQLCAGTKLRIGEGVSIDNSTGTLIDISTFPPHPTSTIGRGKKIKTSNLI